MNATANTRQLLLETGLSLAASKGLRGLTVREVASSAGVNLGSFVYHFGNREAFIQELVELWYAPVFAQLRQTAQGGDAVDPVAGKPPSAFVRLQAVLQQLLSLISQNAPFVRHMLMDAMAGEEAARRFLGELPNRHPKLILALLVQAQMEGSVAAGDPLQMMIFIMMGCGVPLLVASSLQGDWLPPQILLIKSLMADPQAAQQRLQWALKGLAGSQAD